MAIAMAPQAPQLPQFFGNWDCRRGGMRPCSSFQSMYLLLGRNSGPLLERPDAVFALAARKPSDLVPTWVRLADRPCRKPQQMALRSGNQLPEPLKPPMPDQPYRSPWCSTASRQQLGDSSDQERAGISNKRLTEVFR